MVTTVNPLSSGFAYGCQEGETCRPIFKTNSGFTFINFLYIFKGDRHHTRI